MVEVIGGIEPARSLLLAALKGGKPVVTANKALLAENGAEIYGAAREYGADLYYEASVAGAIPLLRPLRESLAGDTVHRVLGIVNGTTNFILDRMDSSGAGFAESLEEAQALGYAEADPTADVEGFDAAAKAAILASLAFHTPVTAADVHREGITEVTATDILSARALGRVVKLLAICERCDGGVSVRVHPAMIPRSHPLGLGQRGLQRGVRGGRIGRPAHVLRRGRGRHPDRERGARRHRRGGQEPAGRHARPGRVHLRRAAGHADGGDAHPVPRLAWTWTTSPACSPRWPRRSPGTTSPSRRSARPAGAPRPSWSS